MKRTASWVFGKWTKESKGYFDLNDEKIDRVTAKDYVGVSWSISSPWFLLLLILLAPVWILLIPVFALFELFSLAAYLLLVIAGVMFFITTHRVITGTHTWEMILAMLVSGIITIGVFVVAPLVMRTEWYVVQKRAFCRRMRRVPIIGFFF